MIGTGLTFFVVSLPAAPLKLDFLKVGSKVSFEILLPREMTGGKSDVKLQCHGTVVRTESGDAEKTGVACVIDGYEFVRTT